MSDKELELWEKEKATLLAQKNRLAKQNECMNDWLEIVLKGYAITSYFQERGVKKVMIYGAAKLGRLLAIAIMKEKEVQVVGFMDRTAEDCTMCCKVPVYMPTDYPDIEDVDMVVVSAISAFSNISSNLLKLRPEVPVVSLETIISEKKNELLFEEGFDA